MKCTQRVERIVFQAEGLGVSLKDTNRSEKVQKTLETLMVVKFVVPRKKCICLTQQVKAVSLDRFQ